MNQLPPEPVDGENAVALLNAKAVKAFLNRTGLFESDPMARELADVYSAMMRIAELIQGEVTHVLTYTSIPSVQARIGFIAPASLNVLHATFDICRESNGPFADVVLDYVRGKISIADLDAAVTSVGANILAMAWTTTYVLKGMTTHWSSTEPVPEYGPSNFLKSAQRIENLARELSRKFSNEALTAIVYSMNQEQETPPRV